MRTGRSLTVCQSLLPGGVYVAGGVYLPGGMYLPGGYLPWGCTCPGGVLARGGVPTQGVCSGGVHWGTAPCEQNHTHL